MLTSCLIVFFWPQLFKEWIALSFQKDSIKYITIQLIINQPVESLKMQGICGLHFAHMMQLFGFHLFFSLNKLVFFIQVITQLLLQRSRHQFLSMALEVEGRKNRDTHRLFSTLESTLGDSLKGTEERSVS